MEAPSALSTEAWTSTSRQDFALTTFNLDHTVALASSPVLLRHALTSILVGVETAVREDEIYCDKLCTKGPLLPSRLKLRLVYYYGEQISLGVHKTFVLHNPSA